PPCLWINSTYSLGKKVNCIDIRFPFHQASKHFPLSIRGNSVGSKFFFFAIAHHMIDENKQNPQALQYNTTVDLDDIVSQPPMIDPQQHRSLVPRLVAAVQSAHKGSALQPPSSH